MSDYLAPWRSPLARALHRNRSQVFSRYLQLATVTAQGIPSNRTVVFRGFLEDSNNLQIITDIRSEKCQHLQHQPIAEICWYFAKTREQFRLNGKITLINYQEKNEGLKNSRNKVWDKLSENARSQFSWENPGEIFQAKTTNNQSTVDLSKPLDTFCLLIFEPQKVDHLELKGNPQNRYLYLLKDDQKWTVNQINP
jgi:PPOX class probable FMN-dependent enzyme